MCSCSWFSIIGYYALVAQWIRVVASEAIGRGFESLRARQSIKANPLLLAFFFRKRVISFPLFSGRGSRVVFTLKVTIFPSFSVSLSIVFLFGVGYCERSRSRFLYFNMLTCERFWRLLAARYSNRWNRIFAFFAMMLSRISGCSKAFIWLKMMVYFCCDARWTSRGAHLHGDLVQQLV